MRWRLVIAAAWFAVCFTPVDVHADPIDGRKSCTKARGKWAALPKAEGCRIRGEASGVWLFYDEDARGRRYLKARAEMKKGKLHGFHKEFHPNGRLRISGQNEAGEEEGTWTGYHPGGQQAFTVAWVNGKREGPIREWYKNCQMATKGSYVGDAKAGVIDGFLHCNIIICRTITHKPA